jgi:hypothetical protein
VAIDGFYAPGEGMTEAEEIVRALADMDPIMESTLGTWCPFGNDCRGLAGDYSDKSEFSHSSDCLWQRARDLCRAEALGV